MGRKGMRNLTVTYFIIPLATLWTNFLRFRWAINAIKFPLELDKLGDGFCWCKAI